MFWARKRLIEPNGVVARSFLMGTLFVLLPETSARDYCAGSDAHEFEVLLGARILNNSLNCWNTCMRVTASGDKSDANGKR
jgi:hypothetical protein